MRWLLIPFLVVAAIVLGASYSSTLIVRAMGPWSATAMERDRHRAGRQPHPDAVRSAPAAPVVGAGLSRRLGGACGHRHIGAHAELIAGAVSAKRTETDDQIDIQIRTPDGLIPSRVLQIRWRKISETPVHASPAPVSAPAPK
jgi:hypothetical protein